MEKIVWKYSIIVLPHHLTAYKMAQLIRYVFDQLGAEKAHELTRYLLSHPATSSPMSTTGEKPPPRAGQSTPS